MGEETNRNHTTARKSDPLEIIQYSLRHLGEMCTSDTPGYEEPERSLLEMLQRGRNFGRVIHQKVLYLMFVTDAE